MGSTEKGFSSPKRPPITSSASGESNENDVNPNQMGSNAKSPSSKKCVVKHFMSPTVSTNSKVKIPRKKILGEKNESFTSGETAQDSNLPILDSRNGLRRSGSGTSRGGHPISAWSYTSKSDDEDLLSTNSADSSLKPYDPLTNYLSPRPKYLRYNPNRRHEMFLAINSGEKEGDSFLHTSGIPDAQKQVGKEESSESDEEPLPLSRQECSSEIGTVEAEKEVTSGSEKEPLCLSPQKCSSEIPIVETEKEIDYDEEDTDEEGEEEEEFEEDKGWTLKGMVKFLFLLAAIVLSTSYVSIVDDSAPSSVPMNSQNHVWGNASGIHTGGDDESGFLEVNKLFVEDTVQIIDPYEASDALLEQISSDDGREENLNWLDMESSLFEEEANSDKETDRSQAECESAESNVATDEEFKVEDDSEGQHSSGSLDDGQSASGNIHDDNQDNEGNQLESDQETDTISVESQIDHQCMEMEEVSTGNLGENFLETECQTAETSGGDLEDAYFVPADTENDSKELDVGRLYTELKSMKHVRSMDLGAISMAAIWFSIASIILAALVWVYSTRAKRSPEPDSLLEGSNMKEELNSVRPSVDFQIKQEKAESIVKPSSAFYSYQETRKEFSRNSYQETTKEFTRIRAPDVELLGEFVLEEYSSSLRSCGRKGNIDTESINPISHADHVESKPQPSVHASPVGSQTPQPVSQVRLQNASDADSTSYGSFTAEKIILRKEAGKDNAKLITTPVRRSSRIRNLSIASP